MNKVNLKQLSSNGTNAFVISDSVGNITLGANYIQSINNINKGTISYNWGNHSTMGYINNISMYISDNPLITGTPSSVGTTNQEGILNAFARQDHIHKIDDNTITNTLLRQSAGVSIIGRSVNSTGNVADITASSDGQVLKRVGGVVGFNGIGISDLPLSGVSTGTYNFVTVNNKGLVTAAQNKSYLTSNQTITVTGDATGSGSTGLALTLATVNSNIGSFNYLTVNNKGLVTAATNRDYTTNQTITLSGDIVGSGSSGISTTIQADSITFAKMQNITSNRILGRSTAGTGDIEQLSLGSGLLLSNGILKSNDYTTAGVVLKVNTISPTNGNVTLTTSNITEGSNLYFTNNRFDTRFITKTLDDLGDSIIRNPVNGQVLKYNGTNWYNGIDNGGGGTVTSVALSLPSIFSVSGSPVTLSGTLTGTLVSQTANTIFAAPNGSNNPPTFRSLVSNDLPTTITGKTLTSTTINTASNNPFDMWYRSSAGLVTSIPVGNTTNTTLRVVGGVPSWRYAFGDYFQFTQIGSPTVYATTSKTSVITFTTPSLPLGNYEIKYSWNQQHATTTTQPTISIEYSGTEIDRHIMRVPNISDYELLSGFAVVNITGINTVTMFYQGSNTSNVTIRNARLSIKRVS